MVRKQPGGANQQEATNGRIPSQSEGDLNERLTIVSGLSGSGLSGLPASLDGRRTLAGLLAERGSLSAAIAAAHQGRAVAANHPYPDRLWPVEEDVNLGVAGEHLVELF